MSPLLDKTERDCELDRYGPFCGLGHHHLHRPEYTVHGDGAPSYDATIRTCLICGKSGKIEHPLPVLGSELVLPGGRVFLILKAGI